MNCRALLTCAFGLSIAVGCASRPEPRHTPDIWNTARLAEADALERALAAQPRATAGALAVRLAFEAPADLDLWVTDPDQESIYFFNRAARSGGSLDADRGCSDDGRRLETVSFDAPKAGRYRVGVDHPQRCTGAARTAQVFVVGIDDGSSLRFERGIVPLGVFRAIVVEFSWPGDGPD